MGYNRHNSAIQTKKQINRKNKLQVVFDEGARKEFLTGFRKRKDERRKKAQEELDLKLKAEVKKIKEETRAKLEKAKSSKTSDRILPDVAHLINSQEAETSVQDFGSHSVSITTLDNLETAAAPWRTNDGPEDAESDTQEEAEESSKTKKKSKSKEDEEELPGMSLKPVSRTGANQFSVTPLNPKERKNIAVTALKALQSTKAFKAKERIKAKKQSKMARYANSKKQSKRKRHHNAKKTVQR